jgi:hypothetical protein
MFFECRAMFLALQGKNGLSDGFGGAEKPVSRRSEQEDGPEALFFLRSLSHPLTWSRGFFRDLNLNDGGGESEWAGNR